MKKIIIAFVCMVFSMLSAKGQDSTDVPVTKKIALVYCPLRDVGVSYCFGKRGQYKIEDVLKPAYNYGFVFNKYAGNEIKLLYSWKSCGHKKIHSGVGIQMEKQDNFNEISILRLPISIFYVPIGIEVFASSSFGFTLDSTYGLSNAMGLPAGVGLRFGASYYF